MTGSPIAIFYATRAKGRKAGWYWDDAETHGTGADVTPQGPFADYDAAKQGALDDCGSGQISRFEDGTPSHYPQDWVT